MESRIRLSSVDGERKPAAAVGIGGLSVAANIEDVRRAEEDASLVEIKNRYFREEVPTISRARPSQPQLENIDRAE